MKLHILHATHHHTVQDLPILGKHVMQLQNIFVEITSLYAAKISGVVWNNLETINAKCLRDKDNRFIRLCWVLRYIRCGQMLQFPVYRGIIQI